jgi:4-amino-4-deoxy-L-arabinose transferase-like glycosyltransferase
MTRAARSGLPRFASGVFIGALILYALAGAVAVPFHGDESTIIATSRDWHVLVIERNPAALFFRDPPPDADAAADQELRLLNGVVTRYAIGLGWTLAGIPVERLNRQWLWGADLDFNRTTGHVPDEQLLFVSRLASSLLLALSIAAVYAIGRRLIGEGCARLAALVYATLPAVLMNGRRATFEGAMLLTMALVMLAGLAVLDRMRARSGGSALPWLPGWLWFGVAAGLAVAAKHTGVMVAAPVGIALIGVGIGLRQLRQTVIGAAGAALVAGAVFLALNPAWWNAPLAVPGEVLRLRSDLLAGQVAYYGGFADAGDRIGALVRTPAGPAQYYEISAGWPEWIGDQIGAYEAGGLSGIPWGEAGVLTWTLVILGAGSIPWRRQRRVKGAVFLAVTAVLAALLMILNPIPWQRYYLPLTIPYAILLGAGSCALLRWGWMQVWREGAGPALPWRDRDA